MKYCRFWCLSWGKGYRASYSKYMQTSICQRSFHYWREGCLTNTICLNMEKVNIRRLICLFSIICVLKIYLQNIAVVYHFSYRMNLSISFLVHWARWFKVLIIDPHVRTTVEGEVVNISQHWWLFTSTSVIITQIIRVLSRFISVLKEIDLNFARQRRKNIEHIIWTNYC